MKAVKVAWRGLKQHVSKDFSQFPPKLYTSETNGAENKDSLLSTAAEQNNDQQAWLEVVFGSQPCLAVM